MGVTPSKLLPGVFVLAAALGGLVFAELGARAMGLGDPVLYRTNTAYRFAPRPDQGVKGMRGASVTINESGYRSTESWTKPASFRVLWLGDSVTYGGIYIDDRETFAELACGKIEDATGLEAVCGNAAVNAYGVDNMVRRLRYDRTGDSANVIVVVVGWNDLFRALQDIGGSHWMQSRPRVWFRALWYVSTYLTSRFLTFLQRGGEGGCDETYGPSVARDSLAGLLQELTNKQSEGKTVLLVRYPQVYETAGRDTDTEPRYPDREPWCRADASGLLGVLEQAIVASDVPYLDLSSIARAKATDSTEPFFYDDLDHLDVRGHRVFAQAIGDKILELTGHDD